MMHVSFSKKGLGIITVLLLGACTPWDSSSSRKSSIVVIAVESLGFENAICADETIQGDDDGFQDLCTSALRFTHFYSSSPLSQVSMASLLTGMDPQEHKVFHNGNEGIPPQMVTLGEKALQAGYRTAFFSGGPPFLAKSGFQQGFEVFDDDFDSLGTPLRPAEQTLTLAYDWIKEKKSQASLAVIFLADVQFPFLRTYTDEKKEREQSAGAQRQEVAESLGHFLRAMKKSRLWDNSYIVVVGLNGEAPNLRRTSLWRENLFRENIHVPLFIKTPQLKEARSVDFLLSMKDVGQLLRDSLEQSTAAVDLILQKLDEWKKQPPTHLRIDSHWARWWMGMPEQISLRTAEYLVLPQKKWQIYHSLVDREEGTALPEGQIDRDKMRWLRSRIEFSYDVIPQKLEFYEFMKTLRAVKMATNTMNIARPLYAQNKTVWAHSVAMDEALRMHDWKWMAESGSSLEKYVAVRQMQQTQAVFLHGACERFFVEMPSESLSRRCQDSLFVALLDWEGRRQTTDAATLEKNFIRLFRSYMKAKQIAYLNLFLELNWDVDTLSMMGPSLTELYLHLPEKAHLKKKVESYRIPLAVGFFNPKDE